MANVFNNNPNVYIDMNTLFPVLNEKVGLTATQWQKVVENANFLYNHLGLSNVEVGTIQTIFTEPATFSDVQITHRSVTINDKPIDYFDFVFYIPSPKIDASLTSETTTNIDEVGMTADFEPIRNQNNVIVGYNFNFHSKVFAGEEISNKVDKTSTNSDNANISANIINENGYIELNATNGETTNSVLLDENGFKYNGVQVATTDDIISAINSSWEASY